MPGTALWITELTVSQATTQKIMGKHRIDMDDVRRAIIGRRHPARKDPHPTRGMRWIVQFDLPGKRRCVAVLYPTQDFDRFNVASVYEL